ncbi:MAG: response regulator [Nitrospirae bacterium]|nr:response regulator [Nitrospirota bacterium]
MDPVENKPISLLYIEDDPGYVRLITEMLKEYSRAIFEPTHVTKLSDALEILKNGLFDVILLDLNLSDSWGFETFERVREISPSTPIVVLTGLNDKDIGIMAVQKGAQDYLGKGEVEGNLLARTIHFALERKRIEIERSNAIEELEKSHQKFRNLSAHLQDLREAERKYIAAELHDELGGLFTAVKMESSLITSNSCVNPEKVQRAGESLVKLADTGIETVRRISTELRPDILDHLGLISAIKWYMSEFQKRAKIRCKCLISCEDINMNKNRATAVFRILQEAVTNVARHSGATKVTVELKVDEDTLIMKIEDNGKGINVEKINNPFSFGLLGMQERTLYLGGKLIISGIPDKGTKVLATIPVSVKGHEYDSDNNSRRPSDIP